jgi:hypothetical protein
MSAPWGVEFNQNILVVVGDDIFEVLTDGDDDWSVIGCGNSFGLNIRFQASFFEVGNESVQVFNSVEFKKCKIKLQFF